MAWLGYRLRCDVSANKRSGVFYLAALIFLTVFTDCRGNGFGSSSTPIGGDLFNTNDTASDSGNASSTTSAPTLVTPTSHEWRYEEKDEWPEEYVACHGIHQSPIAIETQECIKNLTFSSLKFNDAYQKPSRNASVINNGHTVQISIAEDLTLSGGPLQGVYSFAQMHFHWGGNDSVGSEHTVDGRRYPLELHMVHYNKKFPSFDKALGQKDGVLVLGIWYDLKGAKVENKILKPLLKTFRNITGKSDTARVEGLPAIYSFLPHNLNKYFNYEGSLTTPGCTEKVQWIIFKDTQPISKVQLQEYRELREDPDGAKTYHPLENNFRPPQPLNDRRVYFIGSSSSPLRATGNVFLPLSLLVFIPYYFCRL